MTQPLDDDELEQNLQALRPYPEQLDRWRTAAHTDPDRIRSCLTKAARNGENAAAYLDTLVANGSRPLDEEPEPGLPQCPECGPIHLPAGTTLADHRRNVHGVDQDDDPEPAVSTTTA